MGSDEVEPRRKRDATLPVRRVLTLTYAVSLVVALLAAAVSMASLAYRTVVYPTDELLRAFVPNDVVNLLVGVPLLLASVGLARRGRRIGLLAWPGGLLFILYNYIAYILAVPIGAASLAHVALVALSAYGLVRLVAAIDGASVRNALAGAVPERAAGAILAGLGFLFFLRGVAVLTGAVVGGTGIGPAEFAVNVSDMLISPAWLIGGILLWQRKELGYVLGLGLLLGISLLFVALVLFLIIQPLLTAAPFAVIDVVVILVMGLICFVPCTLFARGVASPRHPSSS